MVKYSYRVVAFIVSVILLCSLGVTACASAGQQAAESQSVESQSVESQSVESQSVESSNIESKFQTETDALETEKYREDDTKGNDISNQTPGVGAQYMTTMELTKDMGVGINLGNTFEACGDWIKGSSVTEYETAWGSPVITKAMIEGYVREGFKTLRIPVAWSNMMAQDYTINSGLIKRVREVVGWALEYDMYVILNIHWDGGWWSEFPTDRERCMAKYRAVWTQLAREFGQFDHRLVFESLNEEGCWDSLWNRYGEGSQGKAQAYGLLNEINQTFVDLIRTSGYNNTDRHLLIAGYATDVKLTCDSAFVMPKDKAGRCAVSVHYYTPAEYCVLKENSDWGKVKTSWGTSEDKAELKSHMDMLKRTFIDRGIPVIIGEFGVVMDNKSKEDATNFLTEVAGEAVKRSMCPVLWDITSQYSFYNRNSCSMSGYPNLKENLKGLTK